MSAGFRITPGWRLCFILVVVVWNALLIAAYQGENPQAHADEPRIAEALEPAMTDPLLGEDCKKALKGVAEDFAHATAVIRYPDSFAHYFTTRGDYERAVTEWAKYRASADEQAAAYLDMDCPPGPLVWVSFAAFEAARAERER